MVKNIYKKILSVFRHKKNQHKAAGVGFLSGVVVLVALFYIIRGHEPYAAELAIVKYSKLGTGAIIPASGESVPIYNDYQPYNPYNDYQPYNPYNDYQPYNPYNDYPTYNPYNDYPTYNPYNDYPTYNDYATYPSPSVQSATLEGSNSRDVEVKIICTDSTGYRVRTSGGVTVYSGTYTNPFIMTGGLGGEDTYSIQCTNGGYSSGITYLAVDDSIFTPQIGTLTASPRSIKRGGSTALTWDLQVATSTCRLRALPLYPALCDDVSCKAPRDAAVSVLNNTLTNGNTDMNDPYWLRNGTTRTMVAALTQAAYNTTHAKGKKTVPIEYSTTFNLRCGNLSQSQQVNVLVTDELEQ